MKLQKNIEKDLFDDIMFGPKIRVSNKQFWYSLGVWLPSTEGLIYLFNGDWSVLARDEAQWGS